MFLGKLWSFFCTSQTSDLDYRMCRAEKKETEPNRDKKLDQKNKLVNENVRVKSKKSQINKVSNRKVLKPNLMTESQARKILSFTDKHE